MAERETVFQRLNNALFGKSIPPEFEKPSAGSGIVDQVLFSTSNRQDYEQKLTQYKQQKLLSYQWIKAGADNAMVSMSNVTPVKLMYRDADLMDGSPEIGKALDITVDEVCCYNSDGEMLHIYSKSNRVKSVLEDLFQNRLMIHVTLPMVVRSMLKYGNDFHLLNITLNDGVLGWRELPVYEMERYENGYGPYPYQVNPNETNSMKQDEITFVRLGFNEGLPYKSWQVAHFRLLYDSFFLPYGVSMLHKSRRAWRMWSMMEDAMLIYRLDKSVERRVYKIFVGAINDQDVQAYVQDIANNFKRAPVIDPQTGQIDLRKNFLPVWKETPIPLLDGRSITIEQLAMEYENGKTNYVYSIQDDTHKIVPGKVVWCGKNYTAKNMIKITLDDDTFMVMAPEHEIVMRDGSKKAAMNVSVGESVMPFYRVKNNPTKKYKDRYESVYNPNTGKYEYTHRLVAEEIEKSDESYNTVHHKNFNRYDNTPENLEWRDFFEHREFHQSLVKNNWKDDEIRERMLSNMRQYHKEHPFSEERKKHLSVLVKERFKDGFPEDVAKKISESLREKYATDTEFKALMTERWANADRSYLKTEEYLNKMREIGRKNYDPRPFDEYNHSKLHKEHDAIRSEAMKNFWANGDRETAIRRMTVAFDDFIWNELRLAIIKGIIYNRNTMLEYINTYLIEHLLEINTNERLHNLRSISRMVLQTRIKELGFQTITEYIESVKKNHKIKKIEIVPGDDVYCMTVVGLNGEDDRHNFALRTIYESGEWCENGCFVSNSVDSDFFIPVRSENASSPIEVLQSSQYSTAMDDIDYMQNKIFAGLGVPKTFLNFQEAQGKGQNLSIMDIRFCRMVNRIQQFVLMELNKVAMIHLYLLGFGDEITNFTLSMNNPSIQIESLELDDWTKRIQLAATALADPGNGIQLLSLHYCLKKFMKMSDQEIKDVLNEIRLEKAMAAELATTQQIIKKTGIFDTVDRIYGDFEALNSDTPPQPQGGEGDEMGGGPGGGFSGGLGGDLEGLGEPGMEDMSDIGGDDMDMDMSEAPEADNGGPNESRYEGKPLIVEKNRGRIKSFTERYLEMLSESIGKSDEAEMIDKSEGVTRNAERILDKMGNILDDGDKTDGK